MRKHELLLYGLILLCSLAACDQVATPIQLDTIYNISLIPNTIAKYEITLPIIKPGQNLYVSGYSALNDPDQEPILKINSSSYTGTCEQQSSNLNEVCFVPNANLKQGDKFTIQASCRINCDARITVYLSEVVGLDLGEQVEIQATDAPVEQMFKIYVPTDSNFTEILLIFDVVSDNPKQGVHMYVKTSKTLVYPTKTNHDNVRWLNWGLKSAAVLYKNSNIKAGDSIYVLLSIGEHSFVTFQSRKVQAQNSFIQLNQQFYDYLVPPSTYRIYTLDLSDISQSSLEFSLLVEFQQYSGSPTVEVSLNQQFTNEKLINPSPALTKSRFQIPPSVLKSAEFSRKIVYVRVSTNWGSTFVIHAKLKANQVITLEKGVGEYVQIKGNENTVLIYRNTGTNRNASESFNLKMINQGEVQAELKVFACLEANTYDCNIKKTDNLNNLTATYKQLNIFDVADLNRVQYNLPAHCVRESEQAEVYECAFMVVLNSVDSTKVSKYVVEVEESSTLIILREGQSYSTKVNPEQSMYFCFYLPYRAGKTGNNPVGLEFFVNTFDGSVQLLSSVQVIRPTLSNLPNTKIKRGTTKISYSQGEMKQALYYLTVYGTEYSDFAVTPIVRRYKSNTTNNIRPNMGEVNRKNIRTTSIILKDSIAQTYFLQKGDVGIQFRFVVPAFGNVTLVVTDLVGKVKTYYTRYSDHQRLECVSNYCTFPANPGDDFFIEVEGSPTAQRKFNIAFKQLKQCYKYPFGAPIYAYLEPKDTQCVQFLVWPHQTIEVSSSLTKLQLLNKDVQIAIEFQQTNYTFVMGSNSYQFSKENLIKYCGQKAQPFCNLKIKLISFDFPVHLQFVVQKLQGIITLYDGVVQKIETNLNKTVGKYFRMPIFTNEGVEIFITSETNTQYTIYAQILQGSQSNNMPSYPNLNSKDPWKVTTSTDLPTLTMLPISKSKLAAQLKSLKLTQPWLAISVFSSSSEAQQAVFQIQITQHERILRVGQQHVGFVQRNQIVMYEVYPSTISLLSIRQLGNFKCFKLLDQNKKQITNEDIYIEQPRTVPLQYYVAGEPSGSCMYQISVQDYENSILEITQGFPTRVVLEYQQITYFLYHHTQNITFRIYQFVEAGSSTVYATPLQINDTKGVRDIVDEISTGKFQYKGDQINNLEVPAKENGPDYCFNCYYLIAVKGSPAVHEDIVVVRDTTPVTIREHMIVDSYLNSPEKETFIYYASQYSSFNLSIDVIYGLVTVTVTSYENGPQGEVVKAQSVQNRMMNIPIRQGDINRARYSEATDPLDQQTKYKIQVQAKATSLYHLQVIKFSDTFRIVQGMVSKVQMPSGGVMNLQFSTLIDQGQLQLNIETRLPTNPLTATVYFRAPGSQDERVAKFSSRNANKLLIVSFTAARGHYRIKLNFIGGGGGSSMEMNVLIPKSGLTQLRQNTNVVANRETMFQLYIQEDSYAIIQVYECSGHMKVRGSSELRALQRSTPGRKQVSLTHQNIGGHFVVTSPENVTGQYFIRVQSKQYSASMNEQVTGISYLIKYRLQKKTEKNPYEYIDTESLTLDVGAAEYLENVTIKIGKIKSTDESILIKQLHYIFGIGSSPEDVKNFMVCSPQQNAGRLTYVIVRGSNEDDILRMNVSKLEVIKKVGQQPAYVGAYVVINVKHKNGSSYDDYVYMFEPVYLGKLNSSKVITATGFFEIMVIIALIIGGVVIIYALGVYAINIYRGYSNTNELVQEDSQSKIAQKDGVSEFQMKAQTSEVANN